MAQAVAQLGALLEQLHARVADLEKRAGVTPAALPAAGGAGTSSASAASAFDTDPTAQTRDFDALAAKYADTLAALGEQIGGDVATLGKSLQALFKADRKIIDLATKCKKPDAAKLAELRKGVTDLIAPINDIKKKRDVSHVNHAMGVAEAAPGFAWVCMDMGPCDWITSAKDASEFYLNKVRKQAKDEGGKQAWTEFANAVRDSLTGLHDFVKEHFKPGLSWNPKGYDVDAYLGAVGGGSGAAPAPATAAAGAASSSSPAAAAAAAAAATGGSGAAAAPSGGAAASSSTPKADSASLQSALFAQLGSIDQSSGRTAGLKHVTKDMKAAALKETTPAPAAKTPSAAAGTAAAAGAPSAGSKFNTVPAGTARCELVDKRWYVEFQQTKGTQLHVPPEGSDKELTIAHEVYIYGCKDIAVFIDRKCKGVRVDKCVNVTIMMEAVLSGVEVVDCKKLKLQANQALPSIAIDKTDGVLVGLAWPARDCQIVTSKSSEMNVTFPNKEGDDADWLEQPIPEQFVSKLTPANKLTTTVSELYTA